jgi:hypothetical protein
MASGLDPDRNWCRVVGGTMRIVATVGRKLAT